MTGLPWHKVARGLTRAEPKPHNQAVVSAQLDQSSAVARDRLDALSFPLDRPANVYGALAVIQFVTECMAGAAQNGWLCAHAHIEAAAVLRVVEFAVADHAPEEARQ